MATTIGIHLPLHYAFGRQVAQAAQERLRECGHPAVVLDNSVPLANHLAFHPGFICSIGQARVQPDHLARLARTAGTVLVNVSGFRDPAGLPSVLHDNRAIGRLAAAHLMDIGCRSLAFATVGTWFAEERWRGFAGEAASRGIPVDLLPARAQRAAWLARRPQPPGILAATDQGARRICDELEADGVDPGSVALLGVDDDPSWCCNRSPELSSIDSGSPAIGRRAADLLLELLRGRRAPAGPILVPPRLVVERDSTLGANPADPQVAAALRLLRREFRRRLDAQDLAAAARCNRRTLERRFRAVLGRSPMEELRRVRTAAALDLLRDRSLGLRGIAAACGFSTASRLVEAIKAVSGTTPERWRSR